MMKKIQHVLLLTVCSVFTFGCGILSSNVQVNVCECQTLFDDYFDLKQNASSSEEKSRIAKEELAKNIACAELEQRLGDRLEDEIANCH